MQMNRAIKRQAFRELLERLLSNPSAQAEAEEKTWEDGMLVSREEAKGIIQSLIPKHARLSQINEKTIPVQAPELDSPPVGFPDKRPKPAIPDAMRPPITPSEDARLSPSAALVKESLSNSFFSKEEAEHLALKCVHYENAKMEEGVKEYFISIDHLHQHQRYSAVLAISRAYPKERVKISHFGPEEGEHAVIHFGAKSAERRRFAP
jgi:hypothetical protein